MHRTFLCLTLLILAVGMTKAHTTLNEMLLPTEAVFDNQNSRRDQFSVNNLAVNDTGAVLDDGQDADRSDVISAGDRLAIVHSTLMGLFFV